MKLINILSKINTFHFKVEVIEKLKVVVSDMFDNLSPSQQNDYGDYEVWAIDTTSEIGKESPISKEVAFRPLLLITIKQN